MSEVMGNPANAVSWLVGKLAAQGKRIEPGEVVLTGAPCRPSDVAAGDVFKATFDTLGSVAVSWA
jgi:2-keto-4-pentenoate hydratase